MQLAAFVHRRRDVELLRLLHVCRAEDLVELLAHVLRRSALAGIADDAALILGEHAQVGVQVLRRNLAGELGIPLQQAGIDLRALVGVRRGRLRQDRHGDRQQQQQRQPAGRARGCATAAPGPSNCRVDQVHGRCSPVSCQGRRRRGGAPRAPERRPLGTDRAPGIEAAAERASIGSRRPLFSARHHRAGAVGGAALRSGLCGGRSALAHHDRSYGARGIVTTRA